MKQVTPGSLLYQVSAPKATTGYKYVHVNRNTHKVEESEPFVRSPLTDKHDNNDSNGKKKNHNGINEFYGRSWTYRDVKSFDRIHAFPQDYDRINAKHLHPTNEIPTMHIQAPAADIDRLHGYYLQDIDIKASMTYITSKKVHHFTDTTFKLGGRSSRYFTKFAYSVKLPKHTHIDHYRKLKLRAMASDPSYMREKLGYDMLAAAGRPSTRNTYVRLFINDRAIGLFTVAEKYDDKFLRNEFGGGSKAYKTGILYGGEGASKKRHAADLSYHGDTASYYEGSAYAIAEKPKVGNNSYDALIAFTKFIDDQLNLQKNKSVDLNTTVAAWNKQVDVKGFFINMAFDFLFGNFDDYLQNTNNYFMYLDPRKQRFVYLTWDMDMIFGSGPVKMRKLLQGDYRQYAGMNKRPLTKATLMTVPYFRQVFESQLRTIVHQLFQPSVVNPIIDSHINFIKDDVAWDRSLPRERKGASFFPFGKHNIENWFHNNATGDTVSLPMSFSVINSADYLIRTNADISFQRAIEGPTHHSSLYALKNWFKEKTNKVLPYIDPPTSKSN
ncbi:unnamed protein product [Absidia cylindrospora]